MKSPTLIEESRNWDIVYVNIVVATLYQGPNLPMATETLGIVNTSSPNKTKLNVSHYIN